MFINYLKVALRNLTKQKVYSLINISGLAVGLAIFTLFAIVAGFDSNADNFHKNAKRIYGLIQVFQSGNKDVEHTAFTPDPLLPALLNEFPEIEDGVRAFRAGRTIVKHKDKIFYENNILFVDPNFLSIFTFGMITGDPSSIIAEPYSIALSENAAFKYFGEKNPVGKVLLLDNKMAVTVTGVIKNVDENYSSIQFDFLVSMETARKIANWKDDWNVNKVATFLLLPEGFDPAQLEDKLPAFSKKYIKESLGSVKRMYLLPLLDFRLKSIHVSSFMIKHDPFMQYVLLITGALILLIVSINFMNLSTARYMGRLKEVGLRKVVGAQRLQLMKQFLSESIIMSLIALPISLLIYNFMTTALIKYVIRYQGDFDLWNHPFLIKYLLGVTILVGLFSGGYPAFFLSSFRPARILKGNIRSGKKGSRFRKTLVVTQFSLAIILIVLTMTWKKQIDHIYRVDFGFNRDRIVTVQLTEETRNYLKPLQESLRHRTDILSVTAASSLPGAWNNEMQVIPEGKKEDEAWTANVYNIDYDFTKTLGIKVKEGRRFYRDLNDNNNYIINETMVRQLGWNDPVGKQLTIEGKTGTIIGVVRDFHFRSVNLSLAPAVLRLGQNNLNYILVKFSASSRHLEVLEHIRDEWQLVARDLPLESITLDNYFREIYRGDFLFITIFGFVDIFAIIVSCLGLLGLASYDVERRTKEIGVRKVLGASVVNIIRLLVREFIILIAISNIIAMPAAYFITSSLFMSRIAFSRVEIGVGILLLTSALTFITAVIAVTSQTVKAAQGNPINALKYE